MYKSKNEFYNFQNVKRNKIKRDNGITLIALVISIIVLIILAGISINALMGDNGIIKSSTDARLKSKESGLEEKIKMAIADRDVDKYSNAETLILGDYLQKIDKATVEDALPEDEEHPDRVTDTWYVQEDEAIYTVYENGDMYPVKVAIWDGKTIKSPEIKSENNVFDWYIYTPEQLKFLADFVNNGNSITGDAGDLTEQVTSMGYTADDIQLTAESTVYLMNMIDMGARQEGGELTTGVIWEPIGNKEDKPFIAKFEGQENIVRGLYVSRTELYAGLFGNSTGDIINLSIVEGYVKNTDKRTGAVVGETTGNVTNCKNINTTVQSESNSVGGVVGRSYGKVDSCTNTGKIIGNESVYLGGVCGYTYGEVTLCSNSGSVSSNKGCIGGVVGYAYNDGIISENTNNGNVFGGDQATGGICGVGPNGGKTQKNFNIGKVYGEKEGTGGICGWANPNGNLTQNTNSGEVRGKFGYIGGICGIGPTSGKIENCDNKGKVIVDEGDENAVAVAGICGWMNSNGILIQNINAGDIYGNIRNVAGICGASPTSGKIEKCENTGNIKGEKLFVGGICGYNRIYCEINECKSSGIINGNGQCVGGICGLSDNYSSISKCINFGNVSGIDQRIGGIIGEVEEQVSVNDCVNNGEIIGESKIVGGISGIVFSDSTINNNVNNGNVTGKTDFVAGICGSCNGVSVLNNSNFSTIKGNKSVGGCVGCFHGTVEKCFNKGTLIFKGSGSGVGNFGGVVGGTYTNSEGNIINCYNAGKLIVEEDVVNGVGGVVGWLSITGTNGTVNNNYNVGEIELKKEGVVRVGGAIGKTARSYKREQNFFLEGAPMIQINENEHEGESKTSDYMKTQAFVNDLNTVITTTTDAETGEVTTSTETQDVWVMDTNNINNGYPILKWQLEE